ncbi:hypothetical protein B0O80DRAFT_475387, partial [Mortierella sp. GBAus27b]
MAVIIEKREREHTKMLTTIGSPITVSIALVAQRSLQRLWSRISRCHWRPRPDHGR